MFLISVLHTNNHATDNRNFKFSACWMENWSAFNSTFHTTDRSLSPLSYILNIVIRIRGHLIKSARNMRCIAIFSYDFSNRSLLIFFELWLFWDPLVDSLGFPSTWKYFTRWHLRCCRIYSSLSLCPKKTYHAINQFETT